MFGLMPVCILTASYSHVCECGGNMLKVDLFFNTCLGRTDGISQNVEQRATRMQLQKGCIHPVVDNNC